MSISISRSLRPVYAAMLSFVLFASICAQQPADDQSDVIRISTELVQTGVVVLDKQGRFVEGLKPGQFQLRVDGKPVELSFFERVTAGTGGEEKIEFAARRGAAAGTPAPPGEASYRGRMIIFFIDDLHLSAESVLNTRKAILDFIENQMGPDDQVAIASPSGQIGFLQRFSDLKAVARAALARLNHRPYSIRDAENISMTEYTALRVDQGDKDALTYYADELLKASNFKIRGAGGYGPPQGGPAASTTGSTNGSQPMGMTREMAERNVKQRAQNLLKQSAAVTVGTLSTLESLMRSTSQMSGRKLVFFISDGFYLNDRNTAFGEKLHQITDAAIRSGVVIYSMDARGIVSMTDAGSNRADPQGRLSRSNAGELSASQDALTALAADTGGRALLNSGELGAAVTNALKETSNYYLLAWRPAGDEQKGANFKRIEVSIADRPDFSVRFPKGFLLGDSTNKPSTIKTGLPDTAIPTGAAAKGPQGALMAALSAPSARKGLPTQLSVGFVDVPNSGPVLTAATQMATDVLGYGADGKQAAAIDLAGLVFNDQGKPAGSFQTRVNVNPASANTTRGNAGVIYTYKLPLKPGIYQVRVATRDDKSGKVGSAAQWIEIPDLAAKRLTLSSLMLGGQFIGSSQKEAGGEQVQFSVDRRFLRGSHMNFLTIIYNAARSGSGVDLDARIQLSRNGQAVVTSPVRKVPVEANTDLARIVYGADIALQTLPPGRYRLQIEISDRIANAKASSEISFEIE